MTRQNFLYNLIYLTIVAMLVKENPISQLGCRITMQGPKWPNELGGSAIVPHNIGVSHPSNRMGPIAK